MWHVLIGFAMKRLDTDLILDVPPLMRWTPRCVLIPDMDLTELGRLEDRSAHLRPGGSARCLEEGSAGFPDSFQQHQI